ncbi:hypothetical protein PENSPDRAFT_485028 [Peniophora sp. CONT]|nr:hypothetical protein PENSPDRAFT_485028 [Peniophora sp. CONT]
MRWRASRERLSDRYCIYFKQSYISNRWCKTNLIYTSLRADFFFAWTSSNECKYSHISASGRNSTHAGRTQVAVGRGPDKRPRVDWRRCASCVPVKPPLSPFITPAQLAERGACACYCYFSRLHRERGSTSPVTRALPSHGRVIFRLSLPELSAIFAKAMLQKHQCRAP